MRDDLAAGHGTQTVGLLFESCFWSPQSEAEGRGKEKNSPFLVSGREKYKELQKCLCHHDNKLIEEDLVCGSFLFVLKLTNNSKIPFLKFAVLR